MFVLCALPGSGVQQTGCSCLGNSLASHWQVSCGISPLSVQGNTSDYYHPDNSCLDSVLATGQGLPISLAVLHAEVATRAGLSVQPVNLPGHVINRARVRLSPAADASGMTSEGAHGHSTESGPGADDSAEDGYVYVDVFEGGQLIDELGVR